MVLVLSIAYNADFSDIEESLSGFSVKQKNEIISVNHDNGNISVYFCHRQNCSFLLEDYILSASEHVYCAFFDLDLENVIDALDHKSRSIDVKLIVDTDNYEYVEDLDFVKQDKRSAFMHNKFCIVDDIVFSGSMNPTYNGAYKNNNNIIFIRSSLLAQNYKDEFFEMWNRDFGNGADIRYPVVYLDDIRVENYFCPEDSCSSKIERVIDSAQESVYFMTFSFTHEGIANSILAKSDSIDIKGVFENRGASSKYSKFNVMDYQGMEVIKDKNPAVMHHKVFVIDNKTVVTGSFNPSNNADTRNDENILIIHSETVASEFLEEFEYVWDLE